MKIYTKTGDSGETGIIGRRISKGSLLIDSIGSIDELNACVGVVLSKLVKIVVKGEGGEVEPQLIIKGLEFYKGDKKELQTIRSSLFEIQNTLFDIGAILANGKSERRFSDLTRKLEEEIDDMQDSLEPLKNFILPGGAEVASYIHISRAVCRRAERSLVELIENDSGYSELNESRGDLLIFINRLSDYLFTLARFINFRLGYEDIIWKK